MLLMNLTIFVTNIRMFVNNIKTVVSTIAWSFRGPYQITTKRSHYFGQCLTNINVDTPTPFDLSEVNFGLSEVEAQIKTP